MHSQDDASELPDPEMVDPELPDPEMADPKMADPEMAVPERGSPARDAEVRALRRVVDEARLAEPPPLDWDRLERSLMARVEADTAVLRPTNPSPPRHGVGVALAFAVAGVALLLVLAGQRELPRAEAPSPVLVDVATLPTRSNRAETPAYEVGALAPSSAIASSDEPLRFTLPEVADWTLAPHGRLVVRTVAMPHVLELERGAVHARVVPRHDPDRRVESFVVEAGGARVAVHGTVLTVTRVGEWVVVEVDEGVVSVGPRSSRSATVGTLLTAPARQAFSAANGRPLDVSAEQLARAGFVPNAFGPTTATADEQRAAPSGPGPAPVAASDSPSDDAPGLAAATAPAPSSSTPSARSHAPSTHAPSEVVDGSDAAVAEPPAAPEPRGLSLDEARAVMVACLASDASSGHDERLRVTITTEVSVSLQSDGTAATVRFDPPLRPDLQKRCAGALFGQRIDAPGPSASFRIHFATR